MQSRLNSVSNTTYKAIAPKDEKVHENDHCYQLSIRYDDKQVVGEGIFADHIAPEFSELKAHLRTKNLIAIFIRGSQEVTSDFSRLMDQLRLDRLRNPLLKWYPATTRPNMQKGQELKPEDRPQIEAMEPVYALHSFFDYMTRYGYGTHYNQEHVNNLLDPFAKSIHKMRFFEIPGGENRRVFFFLEMPVDEEVRLLPGDKLQVFLDEEQDVTKALNATITEPLPFSPINQVTGWITRPWNKEARDYKDKRDLKAISWQRLNDVSRATYLIMKQPPHEVGLQLITSDKPYSRSIAALEALNKIYSSTQSTQRQKDNLKFLLGNHMDLVAKVDMYHGIRPKIPQPFKVMSLNAGQLHTVMMTDKLPGGNLLVHGPPGTGKTYLIGEMLKPFFLDSDRHQILLTSANNAGVDSIAARAHQVLTDLQAQGMAPKEKYIVRLHSLETEKSITINDVKVNRGIPADARPKCVQTFDEDDMDLLNRMDMAKIIDNAYKQSVAQKFEGIHDKRVTELELSLGYRMLQVAGIIGGAPFALPPDDRLRNKFAESYRQYASGDEMDKERSKFFRTQTQHLLSHTIANADAIATTLDIAQVPQVAVNYSTAEGLFADEAARVLDSNLWGILEKYPHLTFKILVGDCYQLPPVVQSSKRTNPFYSQISLSVMARLQATGALCAFLEEQMRGLPEMVEPYNTVTYRGRLTHASSTELSSRPIAQAVREFNTMNYGRESNVVYFDLQDVDSETLASGSIYNEGSCAFAMTIIESLILAGVPGSKVILTPYQGQYRILMSALQVMTKTHPEAKEVDVDKIDRRQGSEWDICVIDITRTNGAGFLHLLGRLNTLFSRGKNGLYIIGKKSHIDNLTKSQGRWLRKFQSEYLRFRKVVAGKPTSPYYQPGQVDLNIYDEEELEEQEGGSEGEGGLELPGQQQGDGNNGSWEGAADYQSDGNNDSWEDAVSYQGDGNNGSWEDAAGYQGDNGDSSEA